MISTVIRKSLAEHKQLLQEVIEDAELMKITIKVAEEIINSYKQGGQLLFCGNGGSAADAQHLSTELVSRFYMEREALNAEALTVNTSTLTAIANDYDYNQVFARQVEAKAKKGDVLIGITTSGTSQNVIEAFKAARERGIITVAFTGKNIEIIREYSDYIISVPSVVTPRIQEMHILIGHMICECIENNLFEVISYER